MIAIARAERSGHDFSSPITPANSTIMAAVMARAGSRKRHHMSPPRQDRVRADPMAQLTEYVSKEKSQSRV
jgi:hypothetical protein